MQLKTDFDSKPPQPIVRAEGVDVKILCNHWPEFVIQNNVLYRICDDKGRYLRLVAPVAIRKDILHALHNSPVAGHQGVTRTTQLIGRRFYWPRMRHDISEWIRCCETCEKTKHGPGRGKSKLQQELSGAVFERVAFDIVGPLPKTAHGNEYILVACDYFSKWSDAWAIPDQTAETCARVLLERWIAYFGCPHIWHSDQGPNFTSKVFTHLCDMLNIRKSRTTPYHPQSDGLVERFNQTLQNLLRSCVNNYRDNWDDMLCFCLMAYRATEHASTGRTPNQLVFGYETTMPVDLMYNLPYSPRPWMGLSGHACYCSYVEELRSNIQDSFTFVRENLRSAAKRQARYYNMGLKPRRFQRGQWVWRCYVPEAARKLGNRGTGPYVVVKVYPNNTADIQAAPNAPLLNIHTDDLKPCHSRRNRTHWLEPDPDNESGSTPEFTRVGPRTVVPTKPQKDFTNPISSSPVASSAPCAPDLNYQVSVNDPSSQTNSDNSALSQPNSPAKSPQHTPPRRGRPRKGQKGVKPQQNRDSNLTVTNQVSVGVDSPSNPTHSTPVIRTRAGRVIKRRKFFDE